MNICESLAVTARLFPDNVAIVYQGHSITYDILNRLSIAAAEKLLAAGVRPQDRVALVIANSPAFPVWYYAALRIGAIAVSVNTRLSRSEIEFILSDCDAKALVFTEGTNATDAMVDVAFHVSFDGQTCDGSVLSPGDATKNEWLDAEPDSPALILYTSGTTGFPKGATLSHGNVRSNVFAFNHLCNMQSQDRVLLAVPLFHCFGQNALLNSVLNVGGTLILQQKFDLNETKQLVAAQQITQLYGVPMMFQLLLESCQPSDLSSVNYCFSAAAPLPIQTSRAWMEKFKLPINEGYGLTETSPFASYNHRIKYTMGSIGAAIDSVEMKVVDPESGQERAPGELGEIAIRGPNVMLGYWNRPEDTSAAIRDGWFHSGDIGRVDNDGMFYIVDRVKDMIAVGGLKVFPAEVERVLNDNNEISDVAVVGVPDSLMGEQVIAFVVLANDGTEQKESRVNSIIAQAKHHLASYKLPRRVIIVDELPRNPSGKILKTRLREMYAELTDQSEASDSESTSFSVQNDSERDVAKNDEPQGAVSNSKAPELRNILAQSFASNKVRTATEFLQGLVGQLTGTNEMPEPKDTFVDAGMDSLMIVEMSAQLQTELGGERELPATLIFDHPRICDMAEYLVGVIDEAEVSQPQLDKKTSGKATSEDDLKSEISEMSEDKALEELLKELQ